MGKITIKDVAKYANVSVATVSRVVNGVDYPISDKKRKDVDRAIQALNYVPSFSAQTLKSKRSNLIGLIVRDISDPYFAEIAKGVTETTMNYGCLALVCNSKRDIEYELEYYDTLRQHNVAGIIIAGGGYEESSINQEMKDRINQAKKYGIKTIALAPQGIDIQTIGVDNVQVGRLLAQHLISKNHKKIAFIGGDEEIIVNNHRLKGFIEQMDSSGLTLNQNYIINDEFTWESGYASAKKLLSMNPDITAICCANDNIAIGAMRYIRDKGMRVPSDISIIGVGDLVLSDYSSPKLTSVRIPFYEMGKMCVEILCDSKYECDENKTFDIEVIERNSVMDLN